MPGLIAIEVSAPEPERSQWVASMLEACNTAHQASTCVYAVKRDVSVEQTAQVTWKTPDSATITFHNNTSGRTLNRTLQFQTNDEPREKWRMVGFTTALLAGGASPEPAPPPPASTTPAVVPETEITTRGFNVAVTARALGASGISQGAPKVGGQARVDARAWQAPWLLGVSGEYSRTGWSAPGVEGHVTWSELGIGATVLWYPARDLELLTRVDVLAQRLVVTGNKQDDSDDDALWQPGARFALDLEWPLLAQWYAVVGAQASLVLAPVAVRVDDKVAQRVAPTAFGLNLGVQYRF